MSRYFCKDFPPNVVRECRFGGNSGDLSRDEALSVQEGRRAVPHGRQCGRIGKESYVAARHGHVPSPRADVTAERYKYAG